MHLGLVEGRDFASGNGARNASKAEAATKGAFQALNAHGAEHLQHAVRVKERQ